MYFTYTTQQGSNLAMMMVSLSKANCAFTQLLHNKNQNSILHSSLFGTEAHTQGGIFPSHTQTVGRQSVSKVELGLSKVYLLLL
jgi:hypothetical protein